MKIYSLEKKDTDFTRELLDIVAEKALGQPGVYTLLAADEDDIPVGVLQFFVGTSKEHGTIIGRVTYIFVVPTERENGVAEGLLLEMTGIMRDSGISLCEVAVPDNEETEIIKYAFSAFGFSFDKKDEFPYYEISIGEILGHHVLSPNRFGDIKPLSELRQSQYKYLFGEIKRHESEDILAEDVSPRLEDWDQDVSCFYIGDKGCGAFLLRRREEKILEPKYLAGFGRDVSASILGLISYGAQSAKQKYPEDTIIRISGRKERVKELLKKMCPGITPKKMSVGKINI